MNQKRIIGIVISILVLLITGLICNFKFVDYHNANVEIISVKIAEESEVYQLSINKEENMYLDTVKFGQWNKNSAEIEQVSFGLRDKYGYLLYTQTISAGNEVDGILHPQSRIKGNEEYLIEIKIPNAKGIDTEVLATYYSYMALPEYIKATVIFAAIIVLIMIYLVCTENAQYIKFRNGIIDILNRETVPSFWEYFLWLLLFLIPFMTLMDGDTRAFVHYEVNFWKSIKEGGGIRYFYEFSNKMLEYYRDNQIKGAFEVIYDFPVYVVLGIWGLPLWKVCSAFGLEETSHVWTMIYGKSIYLVFLPITAYIIYKICKNIGISTRNSKWASFLFLSSVVVFVDIGIMGQLDILGMPFTLLGIYYFQKRCKWKFMLFFAVSISFKQFPLFAFIPLLLLIEKKVVYIVRDMVLAVSFTFLANMPFPRGTVAMQVKGEIRDRFIEILLGAKLTIYNGATPVIVLLIGAICVYCYLKETKDQKEIEQFSIFVPLLVMFVLFTSFDSNPYWFIHLAPFLSIMMMYNSKYYNKLILFETIGMLCLILNQFETNYWCFDTDVGEGMLLDMLLGHPDSYLTIEKILPYIRLNKYAPVFFAGYILAISTFIYLSRPGNIAQKDLSVRWQALLRLVLNAGISIIPVFLYVISMVVFG